MNARTDEHQHKEEVINPPWRMTAPLSLTVFIAIMFFMALGPLVKEISEDLSVSTALVGQISTVMLTTMAVFGLVSGPIADHYGQKRSIVAGLVTLSLCALIMAAAPNFPVLLLAALLTGVAASMTIVAFGLTAQMFSGQAQRKAISRVQSSQAAGSILGAPLLTTVAAFTLWRGAYVFVAVLLVVTSLLVARSIAAGPPWPERRISITNVLDAYRPLLKDRSMIRLFAASALRALGWVGPLLYLGAFLVDVHGLSLRQVGLAYMVASGGLFLGNSAAGGPFMKYELRTLFTVTTALMGVGWLVIFLINPPVLITMGALAATAFSGGIAWVCMTSMMAAETPAGPATTMVLNMSIFGFASALGVALAGLLIGLSGFTALGVVFPAFTLMAAGLIWRPRPSLAPSSDPVSAD